MKQIWNEAKYTPDEFINLMGDEYHNQQLYYEIAIKLHSDSLIDLGCGPGTLLNTFRNFDNNILYKGVDSCVKYIEYCKNKYKDNCKFELSSVEDYVFDREYDVCIFKSVLQYVVDYLPVVRRAKQHCKNIFILSDHTTSETDHQQYSKTFDGNEYIEVYRSRSKMNQELAEIGEIKLIHSIRGLNTHFVLIN